MRKGMFVSVCFAAALALGGCSSGGGSTANSAAQAATSQVTSGDVTITVPANWETKAADDGEYIYPDYGGLLYLKTDGEMDSSSTSSDEYYKKVVQGLEADGATTVVSEPSKENIGDAVAIRSQVTYKSDNDVMDGWNELIISGFNVYNIMFLAPSDEYQSQSDSMQAILDTVALSDAEVPTFHASSNQSADSSADSGSSSTNQTSVSQANALKMAKNYLDVTAFSHDGLVDQLEYEGFSHDDAVYGADNCGADWNEQAAKKAAEYLDVSAFSHDGLVEQLEYEGFTKDQAEYGVSQSGL